MNKHAYSNLTALLLANNIKHNDMEKIQKRAFSIIYPFTSYKDTLAKAGRDRQLKETTTKTLESILSEKLVLRQPNLHSSSAYCTCSNGSFTSLSYNTDCFANFVTVKYATAKRFLKIIYCWCLTDLYLQFTSRPQKVSIINFINKSFIYTMIRVIKSWLEIISEFFFYFTHDSLNHGAASRHAQAHKMGSLLRQKMNTISY